MYIIDNWLLDILMIWSLNFEVCALVKESRWWLNCKWIWCKHNWQDMKHVVIIVLPQIQYKCYSCIKV